MKTNLSQPDRDDDHIKKKIRKLLPSSQQKDNKVIEDLLEEHRKRKFFENLNNGYRQFKADMQNDPDLRKQVEEEQRLWDNTLLDGLED